MAKETNKTAYEKLLEFRAGLDSRIQILWSRHQEILGEMAELSQNMDELIIQGDGQDAQAELEELSIELSKIKRELSALQNPNPNGVLGKLITACWNEAVDELQGPMRKQYDTKMKEFEKAKKKYLLLVQELGEIKRKADYISNRASSLVETLPTLRKMAIPHLQTDIVITHDRRRGPIFMDEKEISKLYLGV